MNPFIRNAQNKQTYRDRKSVSGCQGLWEGRTVTDC